MEKKWLPCFCTIILGIGVIVFAWWNLSWAPIALTVLGALVIIRGFINRCCCGESKEKKNCCS